MIVGRGSSANGREAFKYENGMMTGLGDLPGGDFSSEALGVSGDGTRPITQIVGQSNSANGNEAFIWSEALALMLSVEDELAADGIDISAMGWTGLTTAFAIISLILVPKMGQPLLGMVLITVILKLGLQRLHPFHCLQLCGCLAQHCLDLRDNLGQIHRLLKSVELMSQNSLSKHSILYEQ